MSKSIPENYNAQYDLNASNETWTLAEGATHTAPAGHGISEAAQYHDNLVKVDGQITAISMASAGVALQGTGSSVIVGENATIDAWHGVELFGNEQGVVNNGILNVLGTGVYSQGPDNFVTNNGIITVHPSSAEDDVDGIVADGQNTVLNSASGWIDVTGNGITVQSVGDEVTEVHNFGSVIAGNLAFYGWAGNDKLVNRGFMEGDVQMGGGNDTFDGVGGSAQGAVMGGYGDDSYIIDAANIFLFEKANEGTDTVQSKVSWTLGKEFETLKLLGSSTINGKGNELGNEIAGNNKGNKLSGLGGDDDLDGGRGGDVLTGGFGADTFHFSSGYGKDTITDFTNGIDIIDLSDLSGVSDFIDLKKHHLTVSDNDLIIADGADRLIIEDTKKSALDFFDFDF
ncbi:MAG: hemolysin-type calcium-binding repeat family protein [Rhizobium sp.]|nr:hemolysin-type calcium-binding repeat family protein [Rhizobium sp.]